MAGRVYKRAWEKASGERKSPETPKRLSDFRIKEEIRKERRDWPTRRKTKEESYGVRRVRKKTCGPECATILA